MDESIPKRVLIQLNKIVSDLPSEDGWQKSDGEVWVQCACILYGQDQSLEDIRDLLQHMYNEVRSEYGD